MDTGTQSLDTVPLPPGCSWVANKYGQRVAVLDDDLIGREIREHGIYDAEGIEVIEKLLPTLGKPVCLDIGANIGNHSLAMSRLAARVYAFECQPELQAIFRENLRRNAVDNVQLFTFGLAAESGTRTFYIDASQNRGQSSFVKREGQRNETLELELRVGDDLLREHGVTRVDFIKLDVEGLEAEVLKGLAATLRRDAPIVMIEWNSDQSRTTFDREHLFDTLFAGYTVRPVIHTHHRQLWHGKFLRGLRNSIRKRTTAKRLLLGDFYPERDYGNVLFLPGGCRFEL